jgi:hypothetical protein
LEDDNENILKSVKINKKKILKITLNAKENIKEKFIHHSRKKKIVDVQKMNKK